MPSAQAPGPATAVTVANIRTLALVGAAGAGKTSLAEALLAEAGAISTAGSVERGNTVSDADPQERRLQHSLRSALMHLNWRGCRVHLIDTPGAPDFIGQSLPAIEAVETAAVVINASTGIEPMAVRMMRHAAERQLDRLIIVNKIDAPGVDLPALLAQIQAVFGKACLPLNLPDAGASQVVDCFYNRDGHSDFGAVSAAHRALVEQVVEVDAAFVERYLEDGDVDPSELHAPLEQALREGHLIPVCFVSARTGAGVAELLDVVERLLPNPTEGNPPDFLRGAGGAAEHVHATPDPERHVIAHVFKVMHDPYVGKLGILRVHQGTVRRDTQLYVGDGRRPFKVGHLFMLQGRQLLEVSQAVPGDLAAVAKVDDITYDAVLHDAAEDEHLRLSPLPFPVPVHGLAIAPKRRGDEQRLWEILAKVVDEDPCLRIDRHGSTHETVVYGLGELHLRLLLERLHELYKFDVDTRPPRVAYRETVTAPAEGHHRHKKQSGGAGQFGEVFLKVEPLPRGAGLEFVDAVKGGTIPGQYMPAVEKGVRDAVAIGAISGHPIVDLRVTVYDGKHHTVDSKDIAFATAARKALVAAIQQANPVVLEPFAHIDITAPVHCLGDITGDLTSRRGTILGTAAETTADDAVTIKGEAPIAELTAYQTRLNALTGGEGHFAMSFSHYAPAPAALQRQLAEAYKPREDD